MRSQNSVLLRTYGGSQSVLPLSPKKGGNGRPRTILAYCPCAALICAAFICAAVVVQFRDKNRCDIGKSQSKWTACKMETPSTYVASHDQLHRRAPASAATAPAVGHDSVPAAAVTQCCCQASARADVAAAAAAATAAAPPPIDAPCTQCLRHGDLIHARKALTAAAPSRRWPLAAANGVPPTVLVLAERLQPRLVAD
jgi:hypothetical protein